MTGSANVNVSRDKMHSTWQSVAEQTGIFAGKGGFDVTVGEHTQLNGAVISSTASADKNRLDTGTLGFSQHREPRGLQGGAPERRDKHGRQRGRVVRREHGERHAGGSERQRQRGQHHEIRC